MKIEMRIVIIVLAVVISAGVSTASAQTIYGASTVYVGDALPYSIDVGEALTGVTWSAVNGTVPTKSLVSGTTYHTTVTWTTAGSGSVSFHVLTEEGNSVLATLNVTVLVPCSITTPTGASVARCGAGIVNLSATPGNNATTVRWYDASVGGNLVNTGMTLTTPPINQNVQYFISSYNASSGCESSRVSIWANVYQILPPMGGGNSPICGSGYRVLVSQLPTGATEIRWYDAPVGGNLLSVGEEFNTDLLTMSTHFYIASYSEYFGCENPNRKDALVTVIPKPVAPLVADAKQFANQIPSLTASGAPAGGSYKWYAPANLTTPVFTGNPYVPASPVTTSTSNYVYVSAVNQGCEGVKTGVSVVIIPSPVIRASSLYIAKEEPVRLWPEPADYDSYSWQSSTGETGGDATFSTAKPGTVTLTVTKYGQSYSTSIVLKSQFDGLDMNYIIANSFQVDQLPTHFIIDKLSVDQLNQTIQYFDGFGRPLQTVITQGSPDKKDIVQPVAYNDFGLEEYKYLPYTSGEGNGRYKPKAINFNGYTTSEQAKFYNDPLSDNIPDDSKPFSKIVFENSPLNRQQKIGLPGATWQPDGDLANLNDKSVKKMYEVNKANEVLLFHYDRSTDALTVEEGSSLSFYAPNSLYANFNLDEHSRQMVEYTDMEGKVICKKVESGSEGGVKQYACTYYVYDDMDQLIMVLPPEAIVEILKQH